jgi:hypothetical protein
MDEDDKLKGLGAVGAFLSAWQVSFALLVACLRNNGALRDGQLEAAIIWGSQRRFHLAGSTAAGYSLTRSHQG